MCDNQLKKRKIFMLGDDFIPGSPEPDQFGPVERQQSMVGVCGRAEPLPHSQDAKGKKGRVLESHNSQPLSRSHP